MPVMITSSFSFSGRGIFTDKEDSGGPVIAWNSVAAVRIVIGTVVMDKPFNHVLVGIVMPLEGILDRIKDKFGLELGLRAVWNGLG